MHPSFYKVLSDSEAEKFRQAARDKYVPGTSIDADLWHPIYALECAKMNYEIYLLTATARQ